MKGTIRTREGDITKTMCSWSIIGPIQIITNNGCYALCIYILFGTVNKGHVDISRPVTPKDGATAIPMHPALDSIADSRQSIDTITVIINAVTLTVKTYRLQTLSIQTGCMQMSLQTSTERRQRRQGWHDG